MHVTYSESLKRIGISSVASTAATGLKQRITAVQWTAHIEVNFSSSRITSARVLVSGAM
jgi:hypothetical protein